MTIDSSAAPTKNGRAGEHSASRGAPMDSFASPETQRAAGAWEAHLILAGRQQLLTPSDQVIETIARPRAITPVPTMVPWLLGIAHYRGNLLPIFDLGGFIASLSEEAPPPPGEEPRVLVARHPELAFGLLVSKLLGNRRVMAGPDPLGSRERPLGPFATGFCDHEGQRLPVIDLSLLAAAIQQGVSAGETGPAAR